MKKKTWIIIGLLQLLLILAYGLFMGKAEYQQDFGEDEIPLYREKINIPQKSISLRRGSYMISIEYEAENDAYCQVIMNKIHGRDFGDVFILQKEDGRKNVEIMSNWDIKDLYIFSEESTLKIHRISIQETGSRHRVFCFLMLCLFAAVDFYIWQKKQKLWENLSHERKSVLFCITVIILVSSIPLYTNYILSGTDDMNFHLMRIEGLAAGLRDGSFPVKMQPLWMNDYGYPVSIMYGDLFLYLPALLRLIGFPLQAVYKIYIFVINGITACVSYYCGKKISGRRKIGLLTCLLYTLSAYRLMDIYYRSAVGEFTAMMLFPLVFLGLWQLFQSDAIHERKKSCLLLILTYSGILETHMLSFIMAITFSALYCILNGRSFFKRILDLVISAVATIVLNIGFLVPMIDFLTTQNMRMFSDAKSHIQEWGLYIPQIFQSFSFSTDNIPPLAENGISLDRVTGIGLPFMLIILLYLWERLVHSSKLKETVGKNELAETDRNLTLLILSVWMTCYFFPWGLIEDIPTLGFLLAPYQFAWRLGQTGTVFGLFLAIYALKNLRHLVNKRTETALIMFLCTVTVITSVYQLEERIAGAQPLKITSASGIDTRGAVVNGEYLLDHTYGMLAGAHEPQAEEGVLIKSAKKVNGTYIISYENTLSRPAYLKVPFFAYKGYRAIDTATEYGMNLVSDYQNVIMVMVPENYSGECQVFFQEPWYWRAAELVSVFAFIVLLLSVLYRRI